MCLFHKHNDACRTLIAGRARVDDSFRGYPACAAAMADNAEGLRLLCEAGGNPHQPFMGSVYPFTLACMFGARDAIDELAARGAVHLRDTGSDLYQDCLSYAMLFRGGTPEMALQLIAMRADVNERVTPLTTIAYRANAWMPLMNALMSGQYDGAAALILSGAQLDLRDSGGASVMDIAEGKTLPEFVLKAFQGNLEDCRNVVQLALLQNDDLEEMITEAF
eukprot:s337_g26.t1